MPEIVGNYINGSRAKVVYNVYEQGLNNGSPYSRMRGNLWVQRDTYAVSSDGHCTAYIALDGVHILDYTASFTIASDWVQIGGTFDIVVWHNSDGNRTITLEGFFNSNITTKLNNVEVQETFAMPTIAVGPTYSNPTAPSNFTIVDDYVNKRARIDWQIGSAGLNNPIIAYYVQTQYSDTGSDWHVLHEDYLGSAFYVDTSSVKRGSFLRAYGCSVGQVSGTQSAISAYSPTVELLAKVRVGPSNSPGVLYIGTGSSVARVKRIYVGNASNQPILCK